MDATEQINYKKRISLHFSNEVQLKFAFLTKWGFKCIYANSFDVKYTSETIEIHFIHEKRYYLLDIYFQQSNGFNWYSLHEMIQLLNNKDDIKFLLPTALTKEQVSFGVGLLYKMFVNNITFDLLNDKSLFVKLEQQKNINTKKWIRKMEIADLRKLFNKEWENKNFHGIIKISKSFAESELMKSEIMKIQYAHKKVLML